MKKWIYRENLGVIADEKEQKELESFFNADKPVDSKKMKVIGVVRARQLVAKAKENAEAEEASKKTTKPKKSALKTKAKED